MIIVRIFGAGSIGNHLAHACRNKGWQVTICDTDPEALRRTREEIYPERYGQWDEKILLTTVDGRTSEYSDLVIIGTPPDTHLQIVQQVLKEKPPKCMLIEKPLCTPSLSGCRQVLRLAESTGTFVGVGYNHSLTQNTILADEIIRKGCIGDVLSISAMFREHWGGIFAAHPWLNGPQDTYLGYVARGGGASGEHSHAINIFQHFSHVAGLGRITEVSALMDMVEDETVRYDRACFINVKTENGSVGNIIQDVITDPPVKTVRIQGSNGFLEWFANFNEKHDMVRYQSGSGDVTVEKIAKTRPEDFKGEIDHLEHVLQGADAADSPVSLQKGLETMLVIAAIHQSHMNRKTVSIRYDVEIGPESVDMS